MTDNTTEKIEQFLNIAADEYVAVRFDTSYTGLSEEQPYWQGVSVMSQISTMLWIAAVISAVRFGMESDAFSILCVVASIFSLFPIMNICINIMILCKAIKNIVIHYHVLHHQTSK